MISPKPVLILGYGNPSRGDDALAPLLIQEAEIHINRRCIENVEFIVDFQLQIEHALDLKHRELVLFVDASISNHKPTELTLLKPVNDNSYTTHAMTPQAVMQVYVDIEKLDLPECFLLSLQAKSFELGEALSDIAKQSLLDGTEYLKDLLANPYQAYWKDMLNSKRI